MESEGLWIVLPAEGERVRAMPWNAGAGGQTCALTILDNILAIESVGVMELLVDGDVALAKGALRQVHPAKVIVRGDRLTLRLPGENPAEVHITAIDLGIDAAHLNDVAALQADRPDRSRLGLWRMGEASDGPLAWAWMAEGGVSAWLQKRDQTREADADALAAAEAARAAAEEARVLDTTFINPYTFVPLPRSVSRGKPRGHACMSEDATTGRPDGFSGWFDVEWSFGTDHLLAQGQSALRAERLVIPGSTVKGAVRSVHEVLADGCLRVFDADQLPVHRETSVTYG